MEVEVEVEVYYKRLLGLNRTLDLMWMAFNQARCYCDLSLF